MQIERYFEPIEVHIRQEAFDDWGSPIGSSYEHHETIQGRLRQLNGQERFVSQTDVNTSTHRLYCRPTMISYTDHIVYKGTEYKITAINNVMEFDRLMQIDLEIINDKRYERDTS